MNLLDLVIQGAGTVVSVLAEILKVCREMKEGQELCTQLHKRLIVFFSEMEKLNGRGELPPSELLSKVADVVDRFWTILEGYRDQRLFFRLVEHCSMVKKLELLYEDLHALVKPMDPESTAVMVDWRGPV